VVLVHSQVATTSKLSASVSGALASPVSSVRDLGVFIDNDLAAATHVQRTVTLLRCAPPASSPSSLCHRRLLSFTGCVACKLQSRLCQFRPGRASGISTTATPVHSQCCSSCGVSSMPLRPCHRCPCNSALAASTTAGRLHGGCHSISCITRSSTTLSEPASSRL